MQIRNYLVLLAAFAVAACGGDTTVESDASPTDSATDAPSPTDSATDATNDDGAVDDGAVDDGAVNDGAVDDGAVDDGAVDDGAVDDGAVDDGAVVDAAADASRGTQEDGTACTAGNMCASGFCVDGLCCHTACDGTCVGCALRLTGSPDGQCAGIAAGTDPDNECMGPCQTNRCNGRGACEPARDGTICRAAAGACDTQETCMSGVCPADSFAAAGTAARSCASYLCDGAMASCPTTCDMQGDCAGGTMCVDNMCVATRIVFATTAVHNGNLQAVRGPDVMCMQEAAAARLTGTYRAIIWTGTSPTYLNFTGPYVLTDGTKVADNATDLLDGTLDAAINLDAMGARVSGSAWTGAGTGPRGGFTMTTSHCNLWSTAVVGVSGASGMIGQVNSTWAAGPNATCNNMFHVLCAQVN